MITQGCLCNGCASVELRMGWMALVCMIWFDEGCIMQEMV